MLHPFFLFIGWFLFYSPKDYPECTPEVYKTSQDFRNNTGIEGNKISFGISAHWRGTELILRLKVADSMLKFRPGTVFAYQDKNCVLYRYYKEDIFLEVQNKDGM